MIEGAPIPTEQKLPFRQLINIRRSFCKGESGQKLFRDALEKHTPDELTQIRSECGPGMAGKSAFILLALQWPCEVKVEKEGKKENCGNPSKFTLDYDVPFGATNLETVPVCSNTCSDLLKETIINDTQREGYHYPNFQYNGKNRA